MKTGYITCTTRNAKDQGRVSLLISTAALINVVVGFANCQQV